MLPLTKIIIEKIGTERATYLSYPLRFEPLWGTPFRLSTLLFLITDIKRNSTGAEIET